MAASSTASTSPATEGRVAKLAEMGIGNRQRRALPGFGISLGLGMAWLGVVVLLPLAALSVRAAGLGAAGWLRALQDERVQAALKLSFGASFAAALLAAVVGALVAWVVVRYRFPGRRLLDALVDLPFALPTAVAGIALTAIYAPNGWMGRLFAAYDIKIAYAAPGIVIALVFIGLPFAVRTLQPVLETLGREQEEAAASLGASRLTTLRRVIVPELLPAILTGFSLAFARAGRIRLGDLHRRQPAVQDRDRTAADHDPPGGIRLRRRGRDRRAAAGRILRLPAGDQCDSGAVLAREARRWLTHATYCTNRHGSAAR